MVRIKSLIIFGSLLLFSGASLLFSSQAPKITPAPGAVESISTSSPSATLIPEDGEEAKVTRVIDGDTIVLDNGEKVRYIGIDTPEIKHPKKPVECFGMEAAAKNKELVEGKMVRLEKDISERDRYGRLLRFIYLGDLFVNDYLVRQGYAKASTYPPDVKYSKQFVESEKYARENNLGLWSKCVLSPTPNATIGPQSTINYQESSINCSSNSYNCTDFKTQAEAQSVFDYCMKTVGYDVHKLDRDGDGRVCETLP